MSKNVAMGMLEEFLPQDRHIRNRIFRDIYYHDAVAGGAVDIYATLPWSDFYLTGLRDREALDVYHKSVESMRLKILLPAISRDYMVLGVFIGTTVFDSEENIFSAVMPQNIDFCEIVEVPVYGMDPLITLKVPESTRKLFSNAKDPRAQKILDALPKELAESFRGGTIPLEPENTLYIPRRSITSDMIGTSYYERLLPVHLMEKALFRGSIDQAFRRQRAIMHVTVGGDGDDYVPTQQDMESQRDLWLAADMDPTGAILVTRTGITPNEVRSASDFWRVDETSDYFATQKYRALGINESFITGEASYNTADQAMTIFIEQMRAYRALLTQEIFYLKIFPAIAVANDFTRDQYQVLASKQDKMLDAYFNGQEWVTNGGPKNTYVALCADERLGLNMHDKNVRLEDLAVPHIVWQKHLRPEGDQTYMELLSTMQDKGVPVPLSMLAAAGGVDIHSVLNSMDEDVNIRKKVKKYLDKIAEYLPQQQGQGDEAQEAQARALAMTARFGIKRPVGLFNREYDERLLPHEQDKSGRYRTTSRKGRQAIHNKLHRKLAAAMAEAAARDNRRSKRARKENRKLLASGRYGIVK